MNTVSVDDNSTYVLLLQYQNDALAWSLTAACCP